MRKITEDGPDSDRVPYGSEHHWIPVSQRDIETFNDILDEEIDSSFCSSICCCDFCFDDFSTAWPGVVSRKEEFQTCAIGVQFYLSQSRIRDIYSPSEFATLRHFVTCPRCKSENPANVWIYEHDFSDPSKQEDLIRAASALAMNTPFLILENEFAREVRSRIAELGKTTQAAMLTDSLFRARSLDDIADKGQDINQVATFGPPPKEFSTEGRFNHSGHAMLYCASSARTALLEIGEPDRRYAVGEIVLPALPLKILDLNFISENGEEQDVLKAAAQSVLVSAPNSKQGWSRPEYAFSRFVADCAIGSGFDGIRFGSTKDAEGCNLVLLRPSVEAMKNAQLVCTSTMNAERQPRKE